MPDTGTKTYEIAYLINPGTPEDAVFGEAGKITGAIQDARGLVGRIEEPKARKLAYPVGKFTSAYFGWTSFSVEPGKLAGIRKRLSAEPAFIRFAITNEVKRPAKEFIPRPERYSRASPPREAAETKAFAPAAPKEEDQTKIEELDKSLDKILGQ